MVIAADTRNGRGPRRLLSLAPTVDGHRSDTAAGSVPRRCCRPCALTTKKRDGGDGRSPRSAAKVSVDRLWKSASVKLQRSLFVHGPGTKPDNALPPTGVASSAKSWKRIGRRRSVLSRSDRVDAALASATVAFRCADLQRSVAVRFSALPPNRGRVMRAAASDPAGVMETRSGVAEAFDVSRAKTIPAASSSRSSSASSSAAGLFSGAAPPTAIAAGSVAAAHSACTAAVAKPSSTLRIATSAPSLNRSMLRLSNSETDSASDDSMSKPSFRSTVAKDSLSDWLEARNASNSVASMRRDWSVRRK